MGLSLVITSRHQCVAEPVGGSLLLYPCGGCSGGPTPEVGDAHLRQNHCTIRDQGGVVAAGDKSCDYAAVSAMGNNIVPE